MYEQYVLQPTESSAGTGISSHQRQRMAEWSGDTRAACSMRFCVQYYNMASFPVWLQIQYGQMLLFLDRLQILVKQLYFRLFK